MNGILIDITKCTGCETCVAACKKEHELEEDLAFSQLCGDGLSGRRLTGLTQVSENRFAKKQCLHCLVPACEEACLVGALKKTESGAVVYDADKCIGCRYCLLACPVGIPRYEWEKRLPYVQKCDMCAERQAEGLSPACVEACPEGVLLFGSRETLLETARKRIAEAPEKYLDRVYGETELGGTCVMYISDVDLDALGWPETVGDRTIHSYTWPVLSKTPYLGTTVALLLTGTYWVIKRRMELQKMEKETEGMGEDR